MRTGTQRRPRNLSWKVRSVRVSVAAVGLVLGLSQKSTLPYRRCRRGRALMVACSGGATGACMDDLKNMRLRGLRKHLEGAGLDVSGRVDKESLLELLEDNSVVERVLASVRGDSKITAVEAAAAATRLQTTAAAVEVEATAVSDAANEAVAAYEAVAAFKKKFPEVMAKPEPNYLGTPVSETDLKRRFKAFAANVGCDDALDLVLGEPLLLAMQEENLQASFAALVKVADGNRAEAFRVALKRPTCLIAPASAFEGKTLAEFDAFAEAEDAFKPFTDSLKAIGPEGIAIGAAALGVAALGALASKNAKSEATSSDDALKPDSSLDRSVGNQ
eukprot:TRINITY_DN88235_c0_g1_i1.p1 TRINITY_DN88235_c0_g1~~TRINITY_DN88235_c0_g1_i1.p1  ORF type:complete len:384 (+),score=67.41 TRINITY_DN88235_c0_g1_i1:159-1154(+)